MSHLSHLDQGVIVADEVRRQGSRDLRLHLILRPRPGRPRVGLLVAVVPVQRFPPLGLEEVVDHARGAGGLLLAVDPAGARLGVRRARGAAAAILRRSPCPIIALTLRASRVVLRRASRIVLGGRRARFTRRRPLGLRRRRVRLGIPLHHLVVLVVVVVVRLDQVHRDASKSLTLPRGGAWKLAPSLPVLHLQVFFFREQSRRRVLYERVLLNVYHPKKYY